MKPDWLLVYEKRKPIVAVIQHQCLSHIKKRVIYLLRKTECANEQALRWTLKPIIGGWYKTYLQIFREWIRRHAPEYLVQNMHFSSFNSYTPLFGVLSYGQRVEIRIKWFKEFLEFLDKEGWIA